MPQTVTPAEEALRHDVLEGLHEALRQLRRDLIEGEREHESLLAHVASEHGPSARNLLHYVTLRRRDMRDLQLRLAAVGLSSLGRAESHVLVNLDRVLAMLGLALGREIPRLSHPPIVGFRHGEALLARNAGALLGPPRPGRRVRIMVTLPSEAASDPALAWDLVEAGMDCARINCAHDSEGEWGAMLDHLAAARAATGRAVPVFMDLGGPKVRTGALHTPGPSHRVLPGDEVTLAMPGADALGRDAPAAECDEPAVFGAAEVGERIWLDDGAIRGTILETGRQHLRFRVTRVKKRRGAKIKRDKGINLPGCILDLPALTEKDLRDLPFIARHADAVSLSFVRDPEDVRELIGTLEGLAAPDLGLVLKIEKPTAFERIPRLLITAMRRRNIGIMIARGDLAVEVGFERLAEAQEELLWYAEAAHVPTIWATQVLEGMAKTGSPSRAEITDAAMSGRAEAVMLNKGPHVLDAIRSLDDILRRMQAHQQKRRPLLRPLHVSDSL